MSPESTVIALAHRQHLVAERSQLLRLDVTATDISRLVRRGMMVTTPSRGVYGVGGPPSGAGGHLMAGLLSVPGSAASRITAARLHEFPVPAAAHTHRRLEVVTSDGQSSRSPWVDVHRTRHLPPIDLCDVGPFHATTPARTFCDLAADLRYQRMVHLAQRLLVDRRVSLDDLVGCASGFVRRGRKGSRLLRSVLAAVDDGEPIPDSVLELDFIERVAVPHRLELERHVRPPWYDGVRGVVDFANLAARLVVETDGRRWHSISQDVERDRARDRAAARHGFVVLRFGAAEIRRDPGGVAAEVGQHFASRAA
jgi:hypothetical protein